MKKYPFPTKEDILVYVKENPRRISKRDIARAFHIRGENRIKLKKLLKEMTEDGLLDKGHKKQVHIGGELPPVSVVEVTGVDKFGDLELRPSQWTEEEAPPAITLPAHDQKSAVGLGQRLLVRLSRNREKGAAPYVAKVIRKLESSSSQILGIFKPQDDNIALVNPTDKKNRNQYVVGKLDWNGAKEGELVLIEAKTGRRRRDMGPKPARVKECLGSLDDPKSISLIAIHAHNIATEFPQDVLDEAAKSEDPKMEKGREDLRQIPLITVDPADARDHDDAIWAEADDDPKNEGGWHVIVAIADVARYVTPTSALNREARKRGNSTYFPDRVVPMLPESLSNGLCSLKEGHDRYSMAVHMWFDKRGKKIRHKFVRALIRSAGGLSYEEFQLAHDGKPSDRAGTLMDSVIEPLFGAYETMCKGRDFREPLELIVPERKIHLDDKGNVLAIKPRISLEAHRLVEEFMIQANVAAAESLEEKGWPCMFRVHEQPSEEKIESLAEFLEGMGYRLAKGQVIRPKTFNHILRKVADGPHQDVINTVILRSQSQAFYSPENHGHFGLSLPRYGHFTSPIRRYADVLVHRALIGALKLGKGGLGDQDREDFNTIAEHISQTERTSMAAERECTDRYVAAYMASQVGEVFEGKVSGVSRAGLFVTLDGSGGDGLVPISSLGGDYFVHDRDLHMLQGEYTGIIYQLGDKVSVRLREANPMTGGLMLELIDEQLSKASSRVRSKRKPKKQKSRSSARPRRKRR